MLEIPVSQKRPRGKSVARGSQADAETGRVMRDHLLVYVNGKHHEIRGRDAFLSLSEFLRNRLGLIGTKIVCSEGDCGACTVLVGRATDRGSRLHYQSVDACIQFMFQLDAAHIVTVDALAEDGQLSRVQQAMVDCHGSQCGFCTPGFVVSMTGMLEEYDQLNESQLRYGLTGNLCRCTGYTQIVEAGRQLTADGHQRLDQLFPAAEMVDDLAHRAGEQIKLLATRDDKEHTLACPVNLEQALQFLSAHPDAKVVAGATDVGVQINKSLKLPAAILDLNHIAELDHLAVEENQLVLGARASWTAIEQAGSKLVPEFYEILTIFGAPQIRNAGTIGGNIVNASPIADSLPFLMVMESQLELRSVSSTRTVNINDFYRGYKKLDLHPGELLTKITVPVPSDQENLRLYKVSRRRDLDISGFTAAVCMQLEGEQITSANIALGAVGPTVLRPRETEAFLQGQPFTKETMRQAGELAVDEITPISDVRGSADYRLQLTRNIFLKYYHDVAEEAVSV